MAPTTLRSLRHPFSVLSAAPYLPAECPESTSFCPFFLSISSHSGKGEGTLHTVGPRPWASSALRWERGAWAGQFGERGAGAWDGALGSSPQRALPHTYPGAESGQRAFCSASISRGSGRFTSGAWGLGGAALPSFPSAELPSPAPRPAPAPPAPPPTSRRCW